MPKTYLSSPTRRLRMLAHPRRLGAILMPLCVATELTVALALRGLGSAGPWVGRVGSETHLTLVVTAIGAFLMQVGVQGAWGIIPAHLNELSPAALRGLVPGLAYQMGILVAAPVNNIEYALRDHFGYAWALAGFEVVIIVVLATVVSLGPERSGEDFLAQPRTE